MVTVRDRVKSLGIPLDGDAVDLPVEDPLPALDEIPAVSRSEQQRWQDRTSGRSAVAVWKEERVRRKRVDEDCARICSHESRPRVCVLWPCGSDYHARRYAPGNWIDRAVDDQHIHRSVPRIDQRVEAARIRVRTDRVDDCQREGT